MKITSENILAVVFMLFLTVIASFFKPIFVLAGVISIGYYLFFSIMRRNKEDEKLSREILSRTQMFDSLSKKAIFNMPFPLIIFDEEGVILWHNIPFQKLTNEESSVNKNISDFFSELDSKALKDFEKTAANFGIRPFKGKDYMFNFEKTESKAEERSVVLLYLVDVSEQQLLKRTLYDKRMVVGLLQIDNYDDIRNSISDLNRGLLFAKLEKVMKDYFSEYKALSRSYERAKYMFVLERKEFSRMQSKKFEILDAAREINFGNTIPITLSMGFGLSAESPPELLEKAESAMNVALGRGGDQAVVETDGKFTFYGGKTQAVEKRNKVKARMICHALKKLIETSDNVFVMGHKNPDMDAVGSAVGVLRFVEECAKAGYFVTRGENPSIHNLYEKFRKEDEPLLKKFLSEEEAKGYVSRNSLLVIVDHHKPSLSECEDFLPLVGKVVLIDHHRRGEEFFKEPLLVYLEPYASSASELVTELLTYLSEKITLTKVEAEAMLAGIALDTSNFTFKTGVRTFEAASVLRRAGADTTEVSRLFRENFDHLLVKASVLREAKQIAPNVVFSKLLYKTKDAMLIAAEAANTLLEVNGVEASFVLAESEDKLFVSARSYGAISVQIIMERLGGGGHLTSAGAQFVGKSPDEVEALIKDAVDEYLNEDK